jgi:hypothetical protein
MAARINRAATHLSDFRFFVDKPLLQIGPLYYAVDFDLLVSKADNGVFWKVVTSLQTKREQDAFIAFWGKVFERYANWLLEHSAATAAANQILLDPRYADDQTAQICDAIVVNRTTACFLEYKGSVFKAESKYTGDPWKLKEDIETKLVGTRTDRKGLLQLAEAITQVSGPGARRVIGLDVSCITKIVPILLVRDDIALSICFNEYLNFRFKRMRDRTTKDRTVTPLFVLAIDDLERIAEYLDRTPLDSILEARWRQEKTLSVPFGMVDNPAIPDAGSRPPKVTLEGIDLVAQMASHVMFGIERSNPSSTTSA